MLLGFSGSCIAWCERRDLNRRRDTWCEHRKLNCRPSSFLDWIFSVCVRTKRPVCARQVHRVRRIVSMFNPTL
jgi:hypothetical protein